MPMIAEHNAALRAHGWRQFRSASRDRVIPFTGAGAIAQRIKIGDALPVRGVLEGTAVSLEERSARRAAAADQGARASAGAPSMLRETQTVTFHVTGQLFNPTGLVDEMIEVAVAPFDGFLTEVNYTTIGFGTSFLTAIRTSDGFTFATSMLNGSARPHGIDPSPDFFDPFALGGVGGFTPLPRQRSNIPVYGGTRVFVVMRSDHAPAPDVNTLAGMFTFESAVGVPTIGTRVRAEAFRALTEQSAQATREQNAMRLRLELEREKTRRVEIEQAAMTERAKLAVEARRPSGGYLMNPFQAVLVEPRAERQLASRAPTPPPPPRFEAAGAEPPDGTGKTFVSAWNPSAGSIGYLIPDPPRGGRVNVFDHRYTVWDISGKKVGEGNIEPIRSDQDIPPNARISRVRGGMLHFDPRVFLGGG